MNDKPSHVPEPETANELASGSSALDPRDFRNALGTFATGVTIVTAMADDGKPYGLTCHSFASVSLNPPLVVWGPGVVSQGLRILQDVRHFAVNVLGISQAALAKKFSKSGVDRFDGIDWKPGLGHAPLIGGIVAQFQCPRAKR